jgi:predicted Rossmann fold nucleotide-binding protein DprA/Smf involved in DNA uptake
VLALLGIRRRQARAPPPSEGGTIESRMLAAVSKQPLALDALARAIDVDVRALLAIVTELELSGALEIRANGQIAKAAR